MHSARPQRVRDPVHNLIEFNARQLERSLWQVIQTAPFQRLRRIRQLGFSELVFPGATHTRFAHSIGVFHVARQLLGAIEPQIPEGKRGDRQIQVALAAALVHDVGHGMFSHSFEEVGKKLDLPLARHEAVTERLIRDSEITDALQAELGSGFASDVADVIKAGKPGNLYNAIVSSQFDADRLDYMQRDRLMTGIESSGIDARWLMANLQVASVPTGADDEATGEVETIVLGPKAFRTAESYVLSLFQLYPNVYFHKATRAAEKVFASLLLRIVDLVRDNSGDQTGLPINHPIRKFALHPDHMTNALGLDDAVFWGALPLMMEAEDRQLAHLSRCLWTRALPKSIDIRERLEEKTPPVAGADKKDRGERNAKIRVACSNIIAKFEEWSSNRPTGSSMTFVDQARRDPYKKFRDSQSFLDRILIRLGTENLDMAEISPVVASAETFEMCRAYAWADDTEARKMLENEMGTELKSAGK